ncbi:MAG: hypothetical protein QNM02_16655 [Acidimicrobiia bacterium]|nr:hypothetical protein [Acidimicrobiia bacterium]
MANRRRCPTALAVVAAVLSVAVGCSTDDETARAKAEEFVAATSAVGIAPRLTVGVAEALYGDDAAAVCDAFDGGLTSVERLILLGNPSGRRHKTITDHSIVYARLVIETYCPEQREHFRDEVEDLDPVESDKLPASAGESTVESTGESSGA